jgi:transcriptional regulator with XRE-family HTH domain
MSITGYFFFRGDIMSTIAELVGERIRNLRKEKGWSQEELAYRASINRTYMGEIERGESSITVDSLEKITNALSITIEDLFKHLQPPAEYRENETLSLLINKINGLNTENQKILIDLIDMFFRWKS